MKGREALRRTRSATLDIALPARAPSVTLHPSPVILRTIARERGNRFGVYGSTVAPGRVAVGDPVELEP